jgi:hypothetical protein
MTLRLFFLMLLGQLVLLGQIDLAGSWTARLHQDWAERGPGPEIVDYLGLPINDAARTKALSYSASELALPEHQCTLYPPTYLFMGPFGVKLWTEVDAANDKIVAWKISGPSDLAVMTVWMDGRPHPSANAPHPFAGFTTGKWEYTHYAHHAF